MIGKPKYPAITTPLAVCLDGHINARGETFRELDRVSATHLDVVEHPALWADDGLPTDKYRELRVVRFYMPRD